jgi:hypothetical protein
MRALPGHVFWKDDLSLSGSDLVNVDQVMTPGQVTHTYFLPSLSPTRGNWQPSIGAHRPWSDGPRRRVRTSTCYVCPTRPELEPAVDVSLPDQNGGIQMIKDVPLPTEAEEYRNAAEILRDLAAQMRFGNTRNKLVTLAENLDLLAAHAERRPLALDYSLPRVAS